MKQNLEKSVCMSNSTHTHTHTHTHTWWRAVKCCVIMAMVMLGSFGMVKAQNIVINMPSSIAVGVNTDAYITINSCNADVSLCNWSIIGANGQIVSTNVTQATMVFNAPGTYTVRAYLRYGCDGGGSGRDNLYTGTATKTVTVAYLPITISGRVANPCGTGIQGVAIQGFPTSVTTDNDGYYSVTVPYAWSGVVSASLSPFSFSPSQSSVNTTADRTLNFTVNAGSLTGASLSVTRGFSPAVGQTITIGGMIPGYSYVYYYTYTTGGSGYGEITPATSSTQVNQISNVSSFCIRLSCGSMPVCVN